MQWRVWVLYAAALALVMWLATAVPRAGAGRVPCTDVLSSITRQTRAQRGRTPDISETAKRLGTTSAWVEHCMRIYGRRARRPGLESQEAKEQRLEALEEDEPEESAREDAEEPGENEREEHAEKQRGIKQRPTPTAVWRRRQEF